MAVLIVMNFETMFSRVVRPARAAASGSDCPYRTNGPLSGSVPRAAVPVFAGMIRENCRPLKPLMLSEVVNGPQHAPSLSATAPQRCGEMGTLALSEPGCLLSCRLSGELLR